MNQYLYLFLKNKKNGYIKINETNKMSFFFLKKWFNETKIHIFFLILLIVCYYIITKSYLVPTINYFFLYKNNSQKQKKKCIIFFHKKSWGPSVVI